MNDAYPFSDWRANIRGAIGRFADLAYQQRIWVKGEGPEFESGIAKALVRSHRCVRLDDTLTERIANWPTSETPQADSEEFETSDLDRNDRLTFARDLLLATNEPLFTVLSMPGAPYRGANCGHDATIAILEEVLDCNEGILE